MEKNIYKIYHNDFGIAFQWKSDITKQDKIQLVFRNMGFYLSTKEIKQFRQNVYDAKSAKGCSCCERDCDTKSILLKTPSTKVDLAVNNKELIEVEDLITGTLFQLDLDNYLNNLCNL